MLCGNNDDICLWPNGDWCYFDDLEESLGYKSDDFEVISTDELFKRTGEDLS